MQLTTYTTPAASDHEALVRIITGMREAGWTTTVREDEEKSYDVMADMPADSLAEDLMATDQAWLRLSKQFPDGAWHRGTMLFVFGNEPWEVMADCSSYDKWNHDLELVETAINLEGESREDFEEFVFMVSIKAKDANAGAMLHLMKEAMENLKECENNCAPGSIVEVRVV